MTIIAKNTTLHPLIATAIIATKLSRSIAPIRSAYLKLNSRN